MPVMITLDSWTRKENEYVRGSFKTKKGVVIDDKVSENHLRWCRCVRRNEEEY